MQRGDIVKARGKIGIVAGRDFNSFIVVFAGEGVQVFVRADELEPVEDFNWRQDYLKQCAKVDRFKERLTKTMEYLSEVPRGRARVACLTIKDFLEEEDDAGR